MPVRYHIHQDARLVVAIGHGILTDADVFQYQHEAWSRPEVEGFDELIDMTQVERFDAPSGARVRELAQISAQMDHGPTHSKLAVVATADVAFGLGRMFQAYREMIRDNKKQVGIFRTMDQALEFLGVDSLAVIAKQPRR